jgi:hypothetical protein
MDETYNEEENDDFLLSILCKMTLIVFKRSFYDINNNGLDLNDIIKTIDGTKILITECNQLDFIKVFTTRLQELIKLDNVIDDITAKIYISILEKTLSDYQPRKLSIQTSFDSENENITEQHANWSIIDVVDPIDKSVMVCNTKPCLKCAEEQKNALVQFEKLAGNFCSINSFKYSNEDNDMFQFKSLMDENSLGNKTLFNITCFHEVDEPTTTQNTLLTFLQYNKNDCKTQNSSCLCETNKLK